MMQKRKLMSEETKRKISSAKKKIQDLTEIKCCKFCAEKKLIIEFVKQGHLFRNICKKCHAKKHRTGRPNTGQFKKGHIALKPFKKGNIPWMTGKKHTDIAKNNISLAHQGKKLSEETKKKISDANPKKSIQRSGVRNKRWRIEVKDRDEWKCQHCGSDKNLHAHHIIRWKQDETKRFDLDNGVTLCKSCHKKEDGCRVAGWNKGLQRSEEWCKNLSESCKGRKAWNKGFKGLIFSPETQFKRGNVPWNKGLKNNGTTT